MTYTQRQLLVASIALVALAIVCIGIYYQSGSESIPAEPVATTTPSTPTSTPPAASSTEVQPTDFSATDIVERQEPVVAEVVAPEPVFTSPPREIPAAVATAQPAVSSAHQSTLIRLHNDARTAKGVPALSWSDTVAASAQAWADTLAGKGCPLIHSDSSYGENLYYSWTTGALTLNPVPAVANWVEEATDYNYTNNTCAPGAVCGHYTQVVWADSTQVGCGVATCDDANRNTQLWVCQYNPAGNDGTRPY